MSENLEEKVLTDDCAPQETTTPETYVTLVKSSSTQNGERYYCKLCRITLTGIKSKISHLDGKKHLKNLNIVGRIGILDKRRTKKSKHKQKINKIASAVIEIDTCNKNISEPIAVQDSKPSNEKQLENILSEKYKTDLQMAPLDRTCKSTSLKKGSSGYSKNKDCAFTKRSEDYLSINSPHEYYQSYKLHKNNWSNNHNFWNNNENGYYGRDNHNYTDVNYYQYQSNDQPHFSYNTSYRLDNHRNNWSRNYFPEIGSSNRYYDNREYASNDSLNVYEKEYSNTLNHKIYEKEVITFTNSEKDKDYRTTIKDAPTHSAKDKDYCSNSKDTFIDCEKDKDFYTKKNSNEELKETANTTTNFNLKKSPIPFRIISPSFSASQAASGSSTRVSRSTKIGSDVGESRVFPIKIGPGSAYTKTQFGIEVPGSASTKTGSGNTVSRPAFFKPRSNIKLSGSMPSKTKSGNKYRLAFPKTRSSIKLTGSHSADIVAGNTESGLAPPKIYNQRQLRSSKTVQNPIEQNISQTNFATSNSCTEIESYNESDKRVNPEQVSDRISHWLNPLNSRDKAEVNKLLNNYSKSKKKETLLKLKLRTEDKNSNKDSENNEKLFHNMEELTDKINAAESEMDPKTDNSLDLLPNSDASPDSGISPDKTTLESSPKPKRRRKSTISESTCNSNVNTSTHTLRRSSFEKDVGGNKKKTVRKSPASTNVSINIHRTVPVVEYEILDELVLGKRKNSMSVLNKPKKHKCSGSECAIECAYESKINSGESLSIDGYTSSDIYNPNLKEAYLLSDQSCGQRETSQKEAFSINMVENANILDVEDLMKMFALENVTIKKEFDDPLIEAIKNVDVNLLMNVCDPNTTSSENPPSSVQSTEKNCDNLLNKCVDPKTTMTNLPSSNLQLEKNCDNLISKSFDNTPSLPTESSENSPKQSVSLKADHLNSPFVPTTSVTNMHIGNQSSISNAVGLNNLANPIPSSKNCETFETAFPGLSPFMVYVNISNELNKLQKEEEDKRNHLKEVEKMIEQHQRILNELTAQKIKLQTEEDNLISHRKTLTSALSQCVISDSYAVSVDKDVASQQPSEDIKLKVPSIDSALIQVVNQLPEIADIGTLCRSSKTNTSLTSVSSINANGSIYPSDCTGIQKETTNIRSEQCSLQESIEQCSLKENEELTSNETVIDDNEDIIILPIEKKVVNVTVIDLVDSESPTKSNVNNKAELAQNFLELIAHKTIVNSLKVHNGYLYTCSNDYTAKRFNLKDSNDRVEYKHTKRNVLQLCVEAFSDVAIVFTLCSMDSRVSSFNSEDGSLLKTHTFESICSGISSGWGKLFAGLKNGLIVSCNRKESKDLVRNMEPVKSLACTMQGGLRVIIILSISGQVAVRDVERNGLLIRYIKAHTDIPLFMNVYNDYVYLSSSVLLTATNLSTGNVMKKIKMTSPITGLAAFENNIFTTAFSGIVRCYSEGKTLNMKMAYGAGHESLTCIYVYQGWVFTGNRNGVVSVFRFDPNSEYNCQVNSCKNVYMSLEDLDRHVTNTTDHKLIGKNSKCPWRRCMKSFKDLDDKAKKDHLKLHFRK